MTNPEPEVDVALARAKLEEVIEVDSGYCPSCEAHFAVDPSSDRVVAAIDELERAARAAGEAKGRASHSPG